MRMYIFRLAVFILSLSISPAIWAFPLQISGIDTTRTAIWIHDMRFGTDIIAENIDRSLIPASVMKSVTTASMLNIAETDERFVTPVTAEGIISDDGILHGNIVVHTCGDPTIESSYFEDYRGFTDSIVAAAGRAGIKSIEGDVIIDQEMFPDATTPPGWMAEDIPWPYGARLHGANFRDNRFRLSLPSRSTYPYIPDLKVRYEGNRGRGIKLDRKDGSETIIVTGNRKRAVSDNLSMPYPHKAMRHEIIQRLGDAGIEVACQPTIQPDRVRNLYKHLSPTFGEIMKSLMFRSDNLMAEGILRAIAPGATRSKAIAEEYAVWTMAGISAHGVRIVDGSGLSRDNRLTARFLGDVNKFMLGDIFRDDFISLFPRAGLDGTMKNFLSGTNLEGRLAMKTGSMKGVQSYSGYLLDDEGHPTHTVVFIVNGFRCSRAALKNDIQRLLLELFDVSLQDNLTTEHGI